MAQLRQEVKQQLPLQGNKAGLSAAERTLMKSLTAIKGDDEVEVCIKAPCRGKGIRPDQFK